VGFAVVRDSSVFNQTIKLFKYIEYIITEKDDLMYASFQMINESTLKSQNSVYKIPL
jgi:hypothetical protein